MNLDKYTQKAQEAIIQAQNLAREFDHQIIEPSHLLLALLEQSDGVIPALVSRISGSTTGIIAELKKDLETRPKGFRSGSR